MRQAILCGASALALTMGMAAPSAVFAQEENAGVEAVVITGSRIARSDYVAESPIVTLQSEAILARGPQTLDSLFNNTPQFTASNQNSANNPSRQGRNNANLRGLGIQRTLVLLDGRRTQPSDALGAVDLNSISPSLIENIEVITGGASAVYGSDAIAGVVNFKLKRNFQGLEVDAQYGESSRGDTQSRDLSVTMGSNFADDRGNFIVSLSMFDREGAYRTARPFFERSGIASALSGGFMTMAANNLPTQAALNAVFVDLYGAGVPARNAAYGLNSDGTLFTRQTPILNFKYPDGEPYTINEGQVGFAQGRFYPLQTPVTRYTAFMRGRYNLTENLEAYLQFNHMEYTATYRRPGWGAGSVAPSLALIPVTNPFIPVEMRSILASRANPNTPITFGFNTGRVGETVYDFDYDLNEYLVGLRGELPDRDLTWDIYASYGTTVAKESTSGWINVAAWNTLINSPTGGADICPGGFNPFRVESLENTPGQEACFDYLNRTVRETTDLTQSVVEATMQGKLFTLPAGDMRFAGGVGYRKSTFDYQPDEQRVRDEVWPTQPTGPVKGDYNVTEGFVELFIPTLKDLPLMQELNFNVAYRYSDYNLIGGVNTYKASVDWKVLDSVRLRGGYQRAIRAPALAELYAPPERASAGVGSRAQGGGDPCDSIGFLRTPATNPNHAQVRALCLALGVPAQVIDTYTFAGSSVSGVKSGNTGLTEETADTITAGIVWQSRFDHPLLNRLSASLDYYDIQVDSAVGEITAAIGLARCFNADGLSNTTYDPNNFYCRLNIRNPETGGIMSQLQPTLNLGSYKVSGYDFQADWRFDLTDIGLGDWGGLALNLVVSYVDEYSIQNEVGTPYVNYAGTIGNSQVDFGAISFPHWKVAAGLTYSVGPVDLTVRYRWFDAMEHYLDAGLPTPTRPGVESRDYVDLTGSFDIGQGTELRGGILNVFDAPPRVWTGNGATDLGLYDLLQRRYYVGIKHRF